MEMITLGSWGSLKLHAEGVILGQTPITALGSVSKSFVVKTPVLYHRQQTWTNRLICYPTNPPFSSRQGQVAFFIEHHYLETIRRKIEHEP